MSDRTGISWTNATWNPVTGCSHVSPGCEHCYAETLSLRWGRSAKPWTKQNAAENVKLHPDRLSQPLRWREPRMVFVNSMSDLFHENVPDEYIDKVFAVMALAPQHTFQVLTKRPERMHAYMVKGVANRVASAVVGVQGWTPAAVDAAKAMPLPNVWLGVSVEDQRRADERLPILLDTPAAVRFLSCEPLLGPVAFPLACQGSRFWRGIQWIIIGGESGPKHRPMQVEWAEKIAAQCASAGCALFVKQDSGSRPGKQGRLSDALWAKKEFPGRVTSSQVGDPTDR